MECRHRWWRHPWWRLARCVGSGIVSMGGFRPSWHRYFDCLARAATWFSIGSSTASSLINTYRCVLRSEGRNRNRFTSTTQITVQLLPTTMRRLQTPILPVSSHFRWRHFQGEGHITWLIKGFMLRFQFGPATLL